MASPGFRLPEYEYPKNALINFAPVNDAITNYQNQQQQGVENEYKNKLLGFKQQEMDQSNKRFQMDQEKFSDDRLDKAKAELGNVALLTLQNPQQYGPNWSKAVDLYKASALKRNPDAVVDERHYDPTHGPMLALSSANMGQQWLDHQVKQRQVQFQGNADARAGAAEGRAEAMHTPQLQAANLQVESAQREMNSPKQTLTTLPDGGTLVATNPRTGQHQVVVQGGDKSDSKFNDAAATAQVGRYDETVKQGASQSAAMGTIGSLRQLSDKIGAPGIGNTIARTMGPSLRNVGIEVGNLSDMEAFNAIVSRLVPAQRPPGSGTMSDKDVELFKSSLPQIAATADGRKFILNQMEAIARYDIQRSQIASKVLNREIPRTDGEVMLRNMPDPMESFRQYQQQAGGGANGALGNGNSGGGRQRGVNPQTGQVIEWDGSQWVSVGASQQPGSVNPGAGARPPASY